MSKRDRERLVWTDGDIVIGRREKPRTAHTNPMPKPAPKPRPPRPSSP